MPLLFYLKGEATPDDPENLHMSLRQLEYEGDPLQAALTLEQEIEAEFGPGCQWFQGGQILYSQDFMKCFSWVGTKGVLPSLN